MSTNDPMFAVQDGIMALLKSDPEIGQYVTGIHDEIPDLPSAHFPFIAVPDLMVVPDGTHDDPGRRLTVNIQVFARGDVEERHIAQLVCARIMALTDHQDAALDQFVTGHTVWMVRHIETRRLPVGDRTVRRMMVRVDIWTTDN